MKNFRILFAVWCALASCLMNEEPAKASQISNSFFPPEIPFSSLPESFKSDTRYRFVHADVDGNGTDDLVIYDTQTRKFIVRLYGEFQPGHPYYRADQNTATCYAGATDVDYCNGYNRPWEEWGTLGASYSIENFYVGDFTSNGSGRKELVAQIRDGNRLFLLIVSTTEVAYSGRPPFTKRFQFEFRTPEITSTSRPELSGYTWLKPVVGDFNGDGLDDFAGFVPYDPVNYPGVYRLWTAMASTSTTLPTQPLAVMSPLPSEVVTADWNQDKLSDVMVYFAGYKEFYAGYTLCSQTGWVPGTACSISNISGQPLKLAGSITGNTATDFKVGSFNADALPDFSYRNNDSDYNVFINNGRQLTDPDSLARFENVSWKCPWRPDPMDSGLWNQTCLTTGYQTNPAISAEIASLTPANCGDEGDTTDCSKEINTALKTHSIVLLGAGTYPTKYPINLSSLDSFGNFTSKSKRLLGQGKGVTVINATNGRYKADHTLDPAIADDQFDNCRLGSGSELLNQTMAQNCRAVLLEGHRTTLKDLTVDISGFEKSPVAIDNDHSVAYQAFAILIGRPIRTPCTYTDTTCTGRAGNMKQDSARAPDHDITVDNVKYITSAHTASQKLQVHGLQILAASSHAQNVLLQDLECQAGDYMTVCVAADAPVTETWYPGPPAFNTTLHSSAIAPFNEDPQQNLTMRKSGRLGAVCQTTGGQAAFRLAGGVRILLEGCTFNYGMSDGIHLYTSDVGCPLDVHIKNAQLVQPEIEYNLAPALATMRYIPRRYNPGGYTPTGSQIFMPHQMAWENGSLLHITGASVNRNCAYNDPGDPGCLARSSKFFLRPPPGQIMVTGTTFTIPGNGSYSDVESLNRVHITEGQGLAGSLLVYNSQFTGGALAMRAESYDIWEMRTVLGMRPDPAFGDTFSATKPYQARNLVLIPDTTCSQSPQPDNVCYEEPDRGLARHSSKVVFNQVTFSHQSNAPGGGSLPTGKLYPILVRLGNLSTSQQPQVDAGAPQTMTLTSP